MLIVHKIITTLYLNYKYYRRAVIVVIATNIQYLYNIKVNNICLSHHIHTLRILDAISYKMIIHLWGL